MQGYSLQQVRLEEHKIPSTYSRKYSDLKVEK